MRSIVSMPVIWFLRGPVFLLTIHHHKHKCPSCAHVWKHGSECLGDKAAHTCPRCGALQWEKH